MAGAKPKGLWAVIIGLGRGDGGGGFGQLAHSSTFVGLCFDVLGCVFDSVARRESHLLCLFCARDLCSYLCRHLASDGKPGIRTRH